MFGFKKSEAKPVESIFELKKFCELQFVGENDDAFTECHYILPEVAEEILKSIKNEEKLFTLNLWYGQLAWNRAYGSDTHFSQYVIKECTPVTIQLSNVKSVSGTFCLNVLKKEQE